MGTFSDSIMLILRCRDTWRRECLTYSEEGVEGYANDLPDAADAKLGIFKQFYEWLISSFFSEDHATPESVIDFLRLATKPDSPSRYDREELKGKVKTTTLAIAFRVAHAIDHRKGEKDTRVRDMFEYIVHEDFEFSIYALVCPFFLSKESLKGSKAPRSDGFETSLCTRFQQILFFSAISELSAMTTLRCRENPKRLKKSKRVVSVEVSFKLGVKLKDVGQKIGFALERIVRSWDYFARHIGFENTESMVIPYAYISKEDLRFVVIPTREDGFVPVYRATSFGESPSATRNLDEVFHRFTNLPPVIDGYLREFVGLFLNDVCDTYRSCSFLKASHPSEWADLTLFDFKKEFGLLARRFNDICKLKIEAVRKCNGITIPLPNLRIDVEASGNRIRFESLPGRSENATLENNISHNKRLLEAQSEMPERADVCNQEETPKRDDHQNQEASLDSSKVTDASMKKYKRVIRRAMERHLRFWCCRFDELEESDEMLGSEDRFCGQAQLSLYDLRMFFNHAYASSADDKLSLHDKDMDALVNCVATELREGGHGVLFCSIHCYGAWESKFRSHFSSSNAKERRTFDISQKPIVLISHNGPFLSRTTAAKDYIGDPVIFALHVTKKSQTLNIKSGSTDSSEPVYVHSSFPRSLKVLDNINGLVADINSFEGKQNDNLERFPKPIDMLKEIISEYTEPNDLVIDRTQGASRTAEACLGLKKPRRFVGCEENPIKHGKGLHACIIMFSEMLFSP